MTGANLLTLLMSRLGNRTEPELRATCLLEMNLLQETVLEGGANLPWFLITEDATVETTAGERRVEVPDDFIREVDQEKGMAYVPSDGSKEIKLKKMSYDEAMAWYGSDAEGAPEAYALRGDYFMIFPLPDATYSLKLPGYYAQQDDIADNATENAWLKWASDLVLNATGEVVASQHIQGENALMIAGFRDGKLTAQKRLSDMETAREEANRDRSMG